MRIVKTCFTSMLLLLFICTPAFASLNFEVNGSNFKPNTSFVLDNGVTYVEASTIDAVLGAKVNSSGQKVVIIHNNDKLNLTLGENTATLNGQKIDLNAKPYRNNDIVMLPLRGIIEALSSSISWEGSANKVIINHQEVRNGMTANEVLVKASQVMNSLPTYAMEGTMQVQMNMSGIEEEGFPIDLVMKTDILAHCQKEPLTIYTKQVINMGDIPEVPAELREMEMETVMTSDTYYINMPEMGWVKMDLGELNLDDLMQNSNTQDPALMLKQMNDFGMIATFGNDIIKDGQNYLVVNVILDQDKFLNEYQKIMGQLALPLDEMADVLNNMEFTMQYINLVNSTTFMTDYMNMDMTMSLSMASPEAGSMEVLDMDMQMKGFFKVKAADPNFKLPDVSSATELPNLVNQI